MNDTWVILANKMYTDPRDREIFLKGSEMYKNRILEVLEFSSRKLHKEEFSEESYTLQALDLAINYIKKT